MSSAEIICLCYISRSGSTFLSQLISARLPQVRVLPENRQLEILGAYGLLGESRMSEGGFQNLERALQSDPQFDALGIKQQQLDGMRWNLCNSKKIGMGPQAVAEASSGADLDQGFKYFLFKHNVNANIFSDLHEAQPGARLIHIYRDPRAAYASMLDAINPYSPFDRFSEGGGWAVGREWSEYNAKIDALERAHGSQAVFQIRYEDLVVDTQACLVRLADWLGCILGPDSRASTRSVFGDKDRDLHQRVGRAPDPSRIHAWRETLSKADVAACELGAGVMLAHRGYEAITPPPVGLCRLTSNVAHRLQAASDWLGLKTRRFIRLLGAPDRLVTKIRVLIDRYR